MKAQQFNIGDQFKLARDPKETFTVVEVNEKDIVCTSNPNRWQGVRHIFTDTALGALDRHISVIGNADIMVAL